MKVLCDVHLPNRLVNFFIEHGLEAIHGSEILDGWRTKDADFADMLMIIGIPSYRKIEIFLIPIFLKAPLRVSSR